LKDIKRNERLEKKIRGAGLVKLQDYEGEMGQQGWGCLVRQKGRKGTEHREKKKDEEGEIGGDIFVSCSLTPTWGGKKFPT